MIKHAINDEFLDVDFPSQPQFVFGDRGKLPFQEAGPCFEDIYANYTDKEIEEAIEQQDSIGGHLDLLVTRIYDQKQEGSCVGNATCQAIEIVLNRQHGPDRVVHLSAISLYKQIGTSPNSGAYVSDGWKAIHSTGVLPLDNEENRARFKHVMPNTGFHLPYPAGWKETAALFRGLEYTPINTLQGLKTASVKGFPIVVGREGHSIPYVRLMFDSRGNLVFKYPNSWGNWGDNGYGYDTISQIRKAASYAFAVRSVSPTYLQTF